MDDSDRMNKLNDARDISRIILRRKSPTHTIVEEEVRRQLATAVGEYTEDELQRIVSDIEYSISIRVEEPDVLVDVSGQTNWFMNAKPLTEMHYFNRYKWFLRSQGFPEVVIEQMEKDTSRVLSFSANPRASKDSKRGLVVGDVQSGKTANYLALVNMACDFGYRTIVLLAGMTDSLREQTQDRVDAGFIGAISDSIGGGVLYAGVGLDKNEHFAVPLTNTKKDFVKFIKSNLNATSTDYKKPLVLVVKKNKSILEHVCGWLKSKPVKKQNLLIIDDEADNASVNSNKDENNPTQINKKIRELIAVFDVATYVGFTATPFANIFINPVEDENLRDLFPSDFIIQLKTPSNYCGAHWFFDNEESNPHLRFIDEHEQGFLPAIHKKDTVFDRISDSLKESILVFLLGCAVRTLRGQGDKHRSMLINISRFNSLQWAIEVKVRQFVENLAEVVEQETYKPLSEYITHPLLARLHNLYQSMPLFAKARDEFRFDDLRKPMVEEVSQFKTVIINNKIPQDERFSYKNYPNGARVIVIGGFLLSRGLTLEGLMVSYYSRNTNTYDSLLQMGRWFGYRFGYDDLCVLYISQINTANFKAVIDAVDDLKRQFAEMHTKARTPRDFGLMVKHSPDTLETVLLATSRNKMRHSQAVETWLSYGGTVADTSKLYKDPSINDRNEEECRTFFAQLSSAGYRLEQMGSRHIVHNVPKSSIAAFIGKLKIHFENRKFNTETLIPYIAESEAFPVWDVVVATGSHETMSWRVEGVSFSAAKRNCEIRDEEDFIRVGLGNNRLVEPGIFGAGLSQEQLSALKAHKPKGRTYTDYLSVEGRNALLVLYPLALNTNGEALNENPRIGIALGFPKRDDAIRAVYQANERRVKEMTDSLDIIDEEEDIGGEQ